MPRHPISPPSSPRSAFALTTPPTATYPPSCPDSAGTDSRPYSGTPYGTPRPALSNIIYVWPQRHFFNIGTSERGAQRPLFNPASLCPSLPPLSLDCRTHCLARVTEEGPASQLCKFVGIMHTVWPLPSKKKYRGEDEQDTQVGFKFIRSSQLQL